MRRSLHPLVWWIWAGALAIGAAIASSPLLSFLLVGVAATVVYRKSENAPWRATFPWAIKIGLWVIVIRISMGILIGIPIPGNIIFTLPQIPLPSWMAGIRIGGPVTLERLSATAHDGIILASIIALLGAAGALSSPHQLLRSLPIMVYEFGVAVVIATSLLPQLVQSISRIRQAQKLRGQNTRGLLSWRRITLPLLEDALARSLDLAAAMDSRGYGFSRRRSRYRANSWSGAEFVIIFVAIAALLKPQLALLVSALLPLFLAPSHKIEIHS